MTEASLQLVTSDWTKRWRVYRVGVAKEPIRYRSGDDDSARWLDFEFRQDDIVISTRSKSGTTWDT